ncbi:uncharacterized protein LOC131160174 [Malania oleifera]|uniref:uncharacterized protein LOC131160174 n=1 Tax=Malania oleifera TaxID=397392 RepID=UPI0025AE57CC|nr:uncharacterized protein LOC131160174 [Malania oleifera]
MKGRKREKEDHRESLSPPSRELEKTLPRKNLNEVEKESETNKSLDKKRKRERRKGFSSSEAVQSSVEDGGAPVTRQSGSEGKVSEDVDTEKKSKNGKSKKAAKKKKKDHLLPNKEKDILEKSIEAAVDEVYHIPSGDEDCTRGMKKWIMEYHQSRPGLKILQQRIDDFITAHEAQEEQAKKEREARVAEGGWTVVTHHKGRKKTTDSESGITVGSVAPIVATDKLAKKRSKELQNFYRFQKREAQRNEVMMLQSKFEQDKKRIQQLRAARKFRPY